MMARHYAATELRNIPSHLVNSSSSHNQPSIQNGGGNQGQNQVNFNAENFDYGYDTDAIAIFEIDKAFTDYLLCQICFSKYCAFY